MMSDQDMINAILASIQTDANLILLMRYLMTETVPVQATGELQAMCAALGIATS